MPIPVRQLSSTYVQSYSNLKRAPHRNLSGGMIRDIVSFEAPEGSVYDASDMLFDIAGKSRKRGGWTQAGTGAATSVVENILAYRAGGTDDTASLYGSIGVTGGKVYILNRVSGAMTAMTGSAGAGGAVQACRPFQYGNLAVFPFQSLGPAVASSGNEILFAGGGTGANVVITAATVVNGDNRISGISPTSMTTAHVGSIIQVQSAANVYSGRITGFISTSSVRVEPTPKASFTATTGLVKSLCDSDSLGTGAVQLTGRYGLSYQGRIILASTLSAASGDIATKGADVKRNRVAWSQLASEPIPIAFAGATQDGNPILFGPVAFQGTAAIPYFNYTDIPDIGGITGIATVGDGELLIFGPHKMFKITGQLTTNTVLTNALNYSVDQATDNIGIPAPNPNAVGDDPSRSIQYTPGGVVFASADNIYMYDGSKLTGLLTGRNQKYYQARLAAGNPIYGSAYFPAKNHYYLSMGGADQGLMVNLNTLALGRMMNIKVFDAAPDPNDATKLWGVLWWDTTGAAPSMNGGQLIALNPIFSPSSTNRSDNILADVLPTLITKAYMDGELEANKLFRSLYVDFDLRATTVTPSVTVTADTAMDPADASFNALTQGTLSKATLPQRVAMEITNQLAQGKAIEFKFVLNSTCDRLELLGLNVGFEEGELT